MSQPIIFTPSEHKLAIAILRQIGLEKGRIDTQALQRDLGLSSKNAAAIQLCKFRAKIATAATGASPPPTPRKIKTEGKTDGSPTKRKRDSREDFEGKVRKVKRETADDEEGFKIGYKAGITAFHENVAAELLEGLGDAETSGVEW